MSTWKFARNNGVVLINDLIKTDLRKITHEPKVRYVLVCKYCRTNFEFRSLFSFTAVSGSFAQKGELAKSYRRGAVNAENAEEEFV